MRHIFIAPVLAATTALAGCDSLPLSLAADMPVQTQTNPNPADPTNAAAAIKAQPVAIKRSRQPLAAFSVLQQAYAGENTDFGTLPFTSLIPPRYTAMTPIQLPGAKRVSTYALHQQLSNGGRPVVINVAQGPTSEAIADSVWLSGAGAFGRMDDAVQQRLGQHLARLSNNDINTPLIFYCLGVDCWQAYNAGQRAMVLGYRDVSWYRGGVRAWSAAGLPTTEVVADRNDIW